MDKLFLDLSNNKEASIRIRKWATELSEHVIDFVSKSAIKSQVLADFIADWTSPEKTIIGINEVWTVYCDEAHWNDGSAAAAIIISPFGVKTRFAACLEFSEFTTINNVAEYEALLLGLRKMKAPGQPNFIVKTDSKVVKDHVEKESEARNPELIKYLNEVRNMERHFQGYSAQHISRNENLEADDLSKTAASKNPLPLDVLYELITIPSIIVKRMHHIQIEAWRAPLVSFIQGTFEPTSEIEHKRVSQRSKNYRLHKGELYKVGVSNPWLRCIPSEQGLEVLKAIHSGLCRSHIGPSISR